jgi:CheY-like chemotaxis protein
MGEIKTMQERLIRGERLRTIGELSSSVAHEFNNLLTSILARVQLLRLQPLGPSILRDLELVEKASLDAAEVVRRLQTMSRDSQQEHFTPVELGGVIRDAVEFLRPLWATRRMHNRPEIVVRVRAQDGVFVHGDATELREVVTNLLKNSLDAVARGGTINLAVEAHEGTATLVVTDNGPGIPEGAMPRVFDPFFTTKGERGTGLGLSIVQQIVERHGGSIRLTSKSGAGVRAEVRIPLLTSVVPAGATPEAAPAAASRQRVLIVDDDEYVLQPLCRYLGSSGYEVVAARSGLEAMRSMAELAPSVVVTDIQMPGMSGVELSARIREEHPDVPIVLITGYASELTEAEVRAAGVHAVVRKPFALHQLLSQIRGALAGEVA